MHQGMPYCARAVIAAREQRASGWSQKAFVEVQLRMSASPVLFVCEDLQVVICFISAVQEEMERGKMACYARKMEQSLSGTH